MGMEHPIPLTTPDPGDENMVIMVPAVKRKKKKKARKR